MTEDTPVEDRRRGPMFHAEESLDGARRPVRQYSKKPKYKRPVDVQERSLKLMALAYSPAAQTRTQSPPTRDPYPPISPAKTPSRSAQPSLPRTPTFPALRNSSADDRHWPRHLGIGALEIGKAPSAQRLTWATQTSPAI